MSFNRAIVTGAVIGFAVGAVFSVALMLPPDGAVSAFVLIIPFALAAAGAVIVAAVSSYRSSGLRQWTPLSLEVIRQHAFSWFPARGWFPDEDDGRYVSFVKRPGDGDVFQEVVLGVDSFVTTRGVIELGLTHVPDGCVVELRVNVQGQGGRNTMVAFFNSLHDLE